MQMTYDISRAGADAGGALKLDLTKASTSSNKNTQVFMKVYVVVMDEKLLFSWEVSTSSKPNQEKVKVKRKMLKFENFEKQDRISFPFFLKVCHLITILKARIQEIPWSRIYIFNNMK